MSGEANGQKKIDSEALDSDEFDSTEIRKAAADSFLPAGSAQPTEVAVGKAKVELVRILPADVARCEGWLYADEAYKDRKECPARFECMRWLSPVRKGFEMRQLWTMPVAVIGSGGGGDSVDVGGGCGGDRGGSGDGSGSGTECRDFLRLK